MITTQERNELTIAIREYERAAVPGGGGYLACLEACVKWENCFRKYANRLSRAQLNRFKSRAEQALAAAMKP
jgi:hypothetical protein